MPRKRAFHCYGTVAYSAPFGFPVYLDEAGLAKAIADQSQIEFVHFNQRGGGDILARLEIEPHQFVLVGITGEHRLARDPLARDANHTRILAHWQGFVENQIAKHSAM